MQVNFIYDQNTADLPSGMTQALAVAAAYLDHLFANPITVNIQVGYGEITQGGQQTPVDFGAEGGYNDDRLVSYPTFLSLYSANAQSPDQRLALAHMPASNPYGDDFVDISNAELKALGQLPANNAASDGSVGFQVNGGHGVNYNFDPFRRANGSDWDFVDVALHEITHAFGRIGDLGDQGSFTALDLFRYKSVGQLQTSVTGSPAYFSLDGGATSLENFDTTGDSADWGPGGPADANEAVSSLGVANNFGQVDLREFNALGFERIAQTDDFEGKGTSDLIWRDASTGAVSEWKFANGAKIATVSLGAQPDYQIVATGDFNADGTTDLVWRNAANGDVWSWQMRNGVEASAVHFGALSGWTPTTGRFTGAGVTNIVWQNDATGDIWEWIMRNGQHVRDVYLGQRPTLSIIASGNFNGDGTTDLLLRRDSGGILDWTMSNGRRSSVETLGSRSGWTFLGAGDFNGDTTTDLLWRKDATGDVQEWQMSGGAIANRIDLGLRGGETLVATGDYYATGTSDIVWQNASTGATTIWAMLNGQHVSTYDINLGSTSGLQGT